MRQCEQRRRPQRELVKPIEFVGPDELAVSVGYRKELMIVDNVTDEAHVVDTLLMVAALCTTDPEQKAQILASRRLW